MNSEDSAVRWIGFVDDAPKLIANCDVMIRIYDITKLHGEICFYAYYGMHFMESENIVTYFNNNSITS